MTNAWLSQIFDQEIVRRGLRPAQIGVLTVISHHEPITPSDLHWESGIPPGTLRLRIKSLEEQGLIEKIANEADGRSYFIKTTPAAAPMVKLGRSVARAVEKKLEKETGIAMEDLRESLDRLRVGAQSLSEGEFLSGPHSATTGPW